MIEAENMNKKVRFFHSIHFKIALVFALLLLITFQIVGAIFVRQLKNDNLKSFKQRVELSTYVENSLIVALSRTGTEGANTKIKNILDDINNANIQEVQVIDANRVGYNILHGDICLEQNIDISFTLHPCHVNGIVTKRNNIIFMYLKFHHISFQT